MHMLHGSEMWSLKTEIELELHWVEIGKIGYIRSVTLSIKLLCVELRQQLEIEDIVKVIGRSRLQWYGVEMFYKRMMVMLLREKIRCITL